MNSTRILLSAAAAVAFVALSLGAGYVGSQWSLNRTSGAAVPAGLTYTDRLESDALDSPGSGATGDDISRAFENRFRTVAATTLPVVAEINVVNRVTQSSASSPFNFFFGNPNDPEPRQREFDQRGAGSGVLVDRDGDTVYVLTNNHVAGEADEIEVTLNDGRTFDAELVGYDELMDLALVSFRTTEEVPMARLGDSEDLEVGDWVFAVGNPLGFESTVTAGIVSAKARDPEPDSGISGITSFIQTDAAINQGNSGGALVNMDGEVVGINTWIATRNGGSIGLGFAIPVNDAKRAIQDFLESGSVTYSWLGVQTGRPTEALADDLGLDNEEGAFVLGVYEDSPAGKAGVRAGDLIIRVAETDIRNNTDLVKTIANLQVGDPTTLTVIRNGRDTDLTIRTERRSRDSGADTSTLWPGIAVLPVTGELRDELELDESVEGVIVAQVNPDSIVGNGGLQRGDVVTEVNGRAVRSARDFYNSISADTDMTRFRVLRNGRVLSFGFEKAA